MSTSVAKGQGKAVVYATGMNTKFGQIANLTQAIREEESPLQKEIAINCKVRFYFSCSCWLCLFPSQLNLASFDFTEAYFS